MESATDGATLQVRVDALCKGRVFGESLTLSMLHTIMEALQNAKDGDFTRDIGLISEEVRIRSTSEKEPMEEMVRENETEN